MINLTKKPLKYAVEIKSFMNRKENLWTSILFDTKAQRDAYIVSQRQLNKSELYQKYNIVSTTIKLIHYV